MKDIIFDNLLSRNINLTKNKFLQSCYSMPADMPEACNSFIKMIQQCSNNIILIRKDFVETCFAACQRTSVLIGFDHSFHLQACLQGKGMGKDYMQQNRYIVGHCCYNNRAIVMNFNLSYRAIVFRRFACKEPLARARNLNELLFED